MNKSLFDNTEVAFKMKKNFHLYNAIFLFNIITKKILVGILTNLTIMMLKFRLPIKWILKGTIYKHFCGGIDIAECKKIISDMYKMNVCSILDYSVEGLSNENSFNNSCEKKIKIIDIVSENDAVPFAVFKPTSIGRYELFKAVSDGKKLLKDEEVEWSNVVTRFHKICNHALINKTKILIDAEEYEVQKAIDELALEMMKSYNEEYVIVYNTIQLYRWDRIDYLKKLFKDYSKSKFSFGFKLVRGAYMEKERSRATQMGYESPIQPTKEMSDKEFNDSLEYTVKNINFSSLWVGSHNEESCSYLMKLMSDSGIKSDDNRIWFSQLYGMSDNISFILSDLGYNVVKLIPYGPIEKTIPYLIRRANENSSVKGQSNRQFTLIKNEINRRKQLN